jgi:hypothetical protein
MANGRFTRATVVSVRNGRVVLKEESGKHTIIIHEPNPNIIVTVEEVNPPLPSASNP